MSRPAEKSPVLCCSLPFDSVPWFRLSIGILISAQSMSLGMAINVAAPQDHATRLLLYGGMAAGAVLMLVLLGWPLLVESLREIRARRLTMELLFLVGVTASMGISVQSLIRGTGPVYFDIVSLLLVIYTVGKSITGVSRSRALTAMRALSEPIRLARIDSRLVEVASVRPGDRVTVMPGEIIPVDGRIVEGVSFVRTTPFTGQSTAVVLRAGDEVLAAGACEDGTLLIQATSSGENRRIDKLGQLIDSARCLPSALQQQADRFVRWFLPLVMCIAVGTFVGWSRHADSGTALMHALAVLLIACPCAAGLATPLSLWIAMGRLSQRGLILHSAEAIECLAQVRHVVFDKTGTLCDETLELDHFETADLRVVKIVSAVEAHSTHPVALALAGLAGASAKVRLSADTSLASSALTGDANSSPPEIADTRIDVKSVRVLPGRGIEAHVEYAGAWHLVRIERGSTPAKSSPPGLCIDVFIDAQLSGRAVLRETLRDSSQRAIVLLQQAGLDVRVMTGDAASAVGIDALVNLTPDDKHRLIQTMPRTLFVGDGVNDAAAMAAAHASIALAGGAEVALQTAHAGLHGGDLTLVPRAILTARRAVATIGSNLRLAVVYNVVGIVLAASGWLHPIVAALLMAVSSAVVSWRAFAIKDDLIALDNPSPRPLPQPINPLLNRRSFVSRLRVLGFLHSVGILGQFAVLSLIAGLSLPAGALVVVCSIGLVGLILWSMDRLPDHADHLLAMFTLGGLGMNFGWWADLGFTPAVHGAFVRSCCAPEGKIMLFSWMNFGMLALGTPAMYLMRRIPEPFSIKRWCCIGPLIVGCPAMVGGMLLGSMFAQRLGFTHPLLRVGSDFALMMAGMMLGMLLPHLMEWPIKRPIVSSVAR